MKRRVPSAIVLVSLSLLGLFATIEFLPNFPILPHTVRASPLSGSPAILGVFNKTAHSNTIFNTGILVNQRFIMDLNVTNAGPIFSVRIGVNFTASVLHVVKADFDTAGCPSTSGCIFNGASLLANITDNTKGFIDYTIQKGTAVQGNGVILRVVFQDISVGTTSIRVNSGSHLNNPAAVAYQAIDGYFSNAAGPDNYSISNSLPVYSVLRTVSGINVTAPVATISLSAVSGTQRATNISVIGLPKNTVPVLSATFCTPTCAVTLQVQVNGGPAGGTTTAPSGTYPLGIIGNTTKAGGSLTSETWMTLIIRPPHPPTFVISATPATSFEATNGSLTSLSLTASLTCSSCANDLATFSDNAGPKTGANATSYSTISGNFPLTSTFTITIPNDTLTFGAKKFNITLTSSGTYSEVSVKSFITLTIYVVKAYSPLAATDRGFAYSGVPISPNLLKFNVTYFNSSPTTQTAIPVNATAKVALRSDPNIMFVDANGNGHWDPGETVVYDTNANRVYDTGEPVISGTPPAAGTILARDVNIMFVDLRYNGIWSGTSISNDPVVYETDGNGLYDTGDTVITPGTISPGVVIGSTTIASLASRASQTVTFTWDPSTLPRGAYMIIGAGGVGSSSQSNGLVPFTQKVNGDVNGDCNVDIVDIVLVASIFGRTSSDSRWNPAADLNNDGTVNITDLVIVATKVGRGC